MTSVDDRLRDQLGELKRLREEQRGDGALSGGGGGGTSGGVTDDWKAHVEVQLKQLREDVQQTRNWIVAAVAGPMLAIIGLYVYTGTKFDAVSTKFDAVEARIVGVENKLTPLAVEQAKTNAKIDLLLERSAPKKR